MTHASTKSTKPAHRKAKDSVNAATGEAPNTRADVYQRVTDQIIAAVEAGADKWEMPWHTTDGTGIIYPMNATTRKAYRGVNVIALWIAAKHQGYATSEWATYKQWQEIGAQVRKGERSQFVVFWKINDKGEETQDGESDTSEETSRRVFARGYSVFNAAQVDGYTPLPPPEQPPAPANLHQLQQELQAQAKPMPVASQP